MYYPIKGKSLNLPTYISKIKLKQIFQDTSAKLVPLDSVSKHLFQLDKETTT